VHEQLIDPVLQDVRREEPGREQSEKITTAKPTSQSFIDAPSPYRGNLPFSA
jgi:hypothetical protein